jgi:pimeloyl-ACP methyl ester carboxylesterase
MNSRISMENQMPGQGKDIYTTGYVTSKDGTVVGFRQLGSGPGIVLLHGSMSSANSHLQLAEALADEFTVFMPDRRGRGLSGAYSDDYSIREEVDDLEALLTESASHYIFGVSSGGIIALQAALDLPSVEKVAVYEPPLFNDPSVPEAVLTRFDKEIDQGKVAAALVTGMQGAQMGPAFLNAMPRRLLEFLFGILITREAKRSRNGHLSMRDLAPTLHYDIQLIVDASGKHEHFQEVGCQVLLLGGDKSPAYLKAALDNLENALTDVKRIELPGAGHEASLNTDQGGRPELVAQKLKRFFGGL